MGNAFNTKIYDEHQSIMNNLSFIPNNVTGNYATPKRLKIFEYLKNYATLYCFIFLQKTHFYK